MRLTLAIASAASGRLGGVVATTGKAGAQLRARVPRLQPRSPSQQTARHLTGSIASLWRTLTACQRSAWNAIARTTHSAAFGDVRSTPTGYTLFLGNNRRLATLGLPLVLELPSPPPAIPQIASLLALPQYNQLIPPQYLTSLPVFLDPTVPAPFYAVIRATPGLSPTKGHIRRSDLRVVAVFECGQGNTADTYPGWVAAFGSPLPTGVVTFEANLVDPLTGFAGPRVRCSAAYETLPIPVVQPGTVTISQNGVVIAVVPDTVISFGGVPVAGA